MWFAAGYRLVIARCIREAYDAPARLDHRLERDELGRRTPGFEDAAQHSGMQMADEPVLVAGQLLERTVPQVDLLLVVRRFDLAARAVHVRWITVRFIHVRWITVRYRAIIVQNSTAGRRFTARRGGGNAGGRARREVEALKASDQRLGRGLTVLQRQLVNRQSPAPADACVLCGRHGICVLA